MGRDVPTIAVVRILLISTYELGHQPLHVAAPAAELRAAGHEVTALDLAVEAWDETRLGLAEAVAISVPMHTAMRMALEVATRIRNERPDLPIALYGLYAGVGSESTLNGPADRLISGEYEDQLVAWASSLAGNSPDRGISVEIGNRRFIAPERDLLPGLGNYAHLVVGDQRRPVGYVEASHGCRHRCAHCPIPAVYDGRYRVTGAEPVLADIAQLARAGAGHITFGDPDFLNAPIYSLRVLEEAHRRFPELTFDVTVKVEHILRHRDSLQSMADCRVIFLTSAVETLDDAILARLSKGHTAADAASAVDLVRAAGMDIHPTWLPFTPWTTAAGVGDIARFIWEKDLAAVTDPVQLSIRLLIPDGSLMLEVDGLSEHVVGYDPEALGYAWRPADPAMDTLQAELASLAEKGAESEEAPLVTLEEMTRVIARAAGMALPSMPAATRGERPRLSEPWFCCSEPTCAQMRVLEH